MAPMRMGLRACVRACGGTCAPIVATFSPRCVKTAMPAQTNKATSHHDGNGIRGTTNRNKGYE